MSGFIYAVGDGEGRVKIGWSGDPFKRLVKIRSDCPGNIRLLGLIDGTRQQEAELHALFGPWNVTREWFRLEGPVAAFVDLMPKPKPRVARSKDENPHPLAIWRKQNGQSMESLSEAVGVDRLSIWRWENRKRMPQCSLWAKIEAVTGVTPADLATAYNGAG